jgi:hypothetical protein
MHRWYALRKSNGCVEVGQGEGGGVWARQHALKTEGYHSGRGQE